MTEQVITGTKADGSKVTFESEGDAMKALEPGMNVKISEGDEEIACFGILETFEVPEPAPEPPKAKVHSQTMTCRGPVGMFGDIEMVAYHMQPDLKLTVDLREIESYTVLLFFRVVKERVMFTVTGTEEAVECFGKRAREITDEWFEGRDDEQA